MKPFVLIFMTTCFLLAHMSGNCASTNLLQNPGFESKDLSGWEVAGQAVCGAAKNSTSISGAYFQPTQVIAHSGDYAAFNLTANFKHIGSVFSQEIKVQPDTSYRIGFRMLHGHPSQKVKIYPNILIDGKSISTICEGNGYGISPDDYQTVRGEFVANHDQTTIRVSFVLQASGLVLAGMSYDDFFVICNQPVVNISPTSGIHGTVVNISGYNYQPHEPISIQADTAIFATDANENGAFSTLFTIPQHTSGTLTIVVTGAESHKVAHVLFNLIPRGDFGDAPNSSMYPMNTGYFCAPNDFTSPDFLTYQAQFPVISHRITGQKCLGDRVSLEADVYDLKYDEDGVPNIAPYSGQANQDGSDDGLVMPVDITPGATNTVQFKVTAASALPNHEPWYVNILFDWNQDGQWDGGGNSEWAVRNQVVNVPSGSSEVIDSSPFAAGTTIGGCWMRITLTKEPISDSFSNWDGSGEFEYGETEDYFINIAAKSDVWVRQLTPKDVWLGQVITYRLEYGNAGDALAAGVEITEELPQGLTCLSDTCSMEDNRLMWRIDKLYPGEHGSIEAIFRVEPWAGEDVMLTATATIGCYVQDADPNNNISVCMTRAVLPAGNGVITGRIIRSSDGTPVISALVRAILHNPFGMGGMAFTNVNGEYEITGLLDGTYTVSSQMDGYSTRCFDRGVIISGANKISRVDIVLLPIQDKGLIAFCSDYNIHLISPDGSHRQQLTHSPQWDTAPSIAFDSRRVVFIRGRKWNCGDMWVIGMDDKDEYQLTNTGNVSSPSFSIDGRKIIFGNGTGIGVINSDGSGYRELLPGNVSDPAFSPDGSEIVFVMDSDVYLMDINGHNLCRLTRSAAMEYAPSFSPDSSMIMFTRQQDSGDTGVWIMNRDGLNAQEVVRNGFMGRFSPDGRQVVFTAARDGNHDLYATVVDGGLWQQLTTASGIDTYPSWACGIAPEQVCVWPGDTNNDGLVNERDVFPVATYWGETGTARNGSIMWRPQVSTVWDLPEATYADANGDGRVNVNDVLPIGMNWSKSHPVLSGMRAPALDTKDIDHVRYQQVYQTMYEMLDGMPKTEGVVELKQALQGFMNTKAARPSVSLSKLMQNYPNPFNPECWIPYELAEQTHVVIRIYNISGQLIRMLDEGIKDAGEYVSQDEAAYWDGHNEDGQEVASGVYIYQLQVGDKVMTQRSVVCK